MILKRYRAIFKYQAIIIIAAVAFTFSCNHHQAKKEEKKRSVPISFKTIANIDFTEVRRRLGSGLSFDNQGFYCAPSYKIKFLTNDSASVYSPDRKEFINFLVFLEPDSIFNVARSYFKMKKMTKDSIKLQVLEVESDTLHLNRSLVYMTLYANSYIKNVLHTTAETLGRPDKRDTLFIRNKSIIANKIPDSAFAATQPAELKSKSPQLTVTPIVVNADMMNNYNASDGYMNPEFNINITKAYEDFSYTFAVFVDDKGRIFFDKPLDPIAPEYKETTIKTLKGIVDGYLKFFLKVKPGSTLGIKHTSRLILNVVGRK